MNSKKYFIMYDWKPNLNGHYSYHENFETNFFIVFFVKFIILKLKHNIIDIEYRNY